MRILLISQWFDPEPTFKGLTFAQELKRRGHEVEVLTGFPNYPGGKIYPGYRLRLWQREIMDGVSVLRVPLYPSHDCSAVARVLNYCSFAISASIGCLFIRRPDVVYVYHPPATIGLAGLVARLLYKAPIVYDIQDLWPETVVATGMLRNQFLLRLLSKWCQFVYQTADRVVVLSPGFKNLLTLRGIPSEKIRVIYNWCDENAIVNKTRQEEDLPVSRQFTVLFAGTMGFAQALDPVLEAARICATTLPRAQFVFIGGGVDRERLERKAVEMALTNVQFRQRLPMSEMGKVLSSADVLLVHLKDDPLFQITIPSKTQAYMAAGKPILMAVRGDAAELVMSSGGGVVCEPEDPASIARAVKDLASCSPARLEEMGRAGRTFYQRELSLVAGVNRFELSFTEALS